MKFGIFVFGDNHPEVGRSNRTYYEEVLTMAEWAEELGFASFWLGEHHFYWYGILPSPQMVIAALGQRTKKIRLGPAVSILPFHHPLVVAEEYAFADNLCGGRLDFAVGSGFSPVEHKAFGMTMDEAAERYWEAFDVIRKAWTQESVSHKGKFYQIENQTLFVKPVQKPMPPIWVAASSNGTLARAGELGFAIMGIPFARSNTILDVKEKIDLFKESYFRAGHREEPDIIVALHVYLHQNEEEAVRLGRPYFQRALEFHRTHRRPGSKVVEFDNVKREGLVVFSSPDRAEQILREYEKIGVTQVICMVNFGGAPMGDVRRTMELISKELMPRLRRV